MISFNKCSFPSFASLFRYIDIVESLKVDKDKSLLTKATLNEQLMRLMKTDVASEDVDLIFLIFDDDNNGIIRKNEFKNVVQRFTDKIHHR